jgi:hypothetical protein
VRVNVSARLASFVAKRLVNNGIRCILVELVFQALLLSVCSRRVEIFGVQVSRSNAVSGADGVAQLLDLREIGVAGKGHGRDSWAEIIHSLLFAGFVVLRVVVHWGRRRKVMWGALGR